MDKPAQTRVRVHTRDQKLHPLWVSLVLLGASTVAQADDRITLSGPEQTLVTQDDQFLLHYTEEGEDAIPSFDYLDFIENGLMIGSTAYVDEGWLVPPGDEGIGGGDRIDVYVREIDAFGYAHSEDDLSIPSDVSCYMEIDPLIPGGLNTVSSVAAHEWHHCVQYQYRAGYSDWYNEAESTYHQYRLFSDEVTDIAVTLLYAIRLDAPEKPIAEKGNRFEYAGLSFPKFFNEYSEGTIRGPEIWERMVEQTLWADALAQEAPENFDLNIDQLIMEYATWNAFSCGRDDGQHYQDDGAACRSPEDLLSYTTVDDTFSVMHLDGPYSTAYFEINADGSTDAALLECDAVSAERRLGAQLIAVDEQGQYTGSAMAFATDGSTLTIDLAQAVDGAGKFVVVTQATGESASANCSLSRYPLPETDTGCACSNAPAQGSWFSVLPLFFLAFCRRKSA